MQGNVAGIMLLKTSKTGKLFSTDSNNVIRLLSTNFNTLEKMNMTSGAMCLDLSPNEIMVAVGSDYG